MEGVAFLFRMQDTPATSKGTTTVCADKLLVTEDFPLNSNCLKVILASAFGARMARRKSFQRVAAVEAESEI